LETSTHHKPDREHVRDRSASNDPIKGLSLKQDCTRDDLQAAQAAEKSWHRLRGHNQLPKVILGVKFNDGIEVVSSQAQPAAA